MLESVVWSAQPPAPCRKRLVIVDSFESHVNDGYGTWFHFSNRLAEPIELTASSEIRLLSLFLQPGIDNWTQPIVVCCSMVAPTQSCCGRAASAVGLVSGDSTLLHDPASVKMHDPPFRTPTVKFGDSQGATYRSTAGESVGVSARPGRYESVDIELRSTNLFEPLPYYLSDRACVSLLVCNYR